MTMIKTISHLVKHLEDRYREIHEPQEYFAAWEDYSEPKKHFRFGYFAAIRELENLRTEIINNESKS